MHEQVEQHDEQQPQQTEEPQSVTLEIQDMSISGTAKIDEVTDGQVGQ